jgi:NAD-dependent dihydropyrimidine dehydrogenase PreA subunit
MNIPRELVPWFPTINAEQCDNCGVCLSFCKHGVYAAGETSMTVAMPYNCVVGCSGCQPQCPNAAISFPDVDEFVTVVREIRARYASRDAGQLPVTGS